MESESWPEAKARLEQLLRLSDEDEGIAEALRRDAEIEADPDLAISLAQLDSHIQSRRG
jgi:hypothetical protein